MQNTLIERLFWHTSERDESKVAQQLFCRKEMDTVYTLEGGGVDRKIELTPDRHLKLTP